MVGTLMLLVSLNASPVEEFKTAWHNVRDYTCVMEVYERKGRKERFRVYKYSFMRPKWIKMIVIEGSDKGGKAAYNPENGKVYARKPGLAGKIRIKLSPDNPLVKSLRGTKITESDFGYLLLEIKNGRQLKVIGDTTINGKQVVGINFLKPNGINTTIYFDKTSHFPVYLVEKDSTGQLIHWVKYRNLKVNVGLKKEDFEI